MAFNLAPVFKQRFFDANGNPLAGGFIYTYQAGTTTPQATYTDSTGNTANSNPIELDAAGKANIWLNIALSYKVAIHDSSDALIETIDNIIGLVTNDTVTTNSIQDDAVTTAKLADDAVTADILKDDASIDANRAVTTNHVRDAAITEVKLDNATTSAPLDLKNYSIEGSVAANALTVSLKTKAGADAGASTPISIAFRSSTAASGVYVKRSVTAALSMVVSSGSTLGHASGSVNQYVHVYAIDNAGTVELAVSGTRLFDEGSLVSTTAEGGGGGADSGILLYSTTARSNVACRYLGRLKSTQATAGTWSTSIAEVSTAPSDKKVSPRSVVWVYGGNGHGSTNTKIRRFNNIQLNVGSDITYADSGTNGGSFTLNSDGLYEISYADSRSGAGATYGISANSSVLTTNINSATTAQGSLGCITQTTACSAVIKIPYIGKAGDIIRAHTQGTQDASGTDTSCFMQVSLIERY